MAKHRVNASFSSFIMPGFKEVSTSPSISVLLCWTPQGMVRSRNRIFVREIPSTASVGPCSSFLQRSSSPGSELRYSFFHVLQIASVSERRTCPSSPCGRRRTALASLGMALSFNPPERDAREYWSSCPSPCRARPKSITALPRSLWISPPEWPPCSPDTVIS